MVLRYLWVLLGLVLALPTVEEQFFLAAEADTPVLRREAAFLVVSSLDDALAGAFDVAGRIPCIDHQRAILHQRFVIDAVVVRADQGGVIK